MAEQKDSGSCQLVLRDALLLLVLPAAASRAQHLPSPPTAAPLSTPTYGSWYVHVEAVAEHAFNQTCFTHPGVPYKDDLRTAVVAGGRVKGCMDVAGTAAAGSGPTTIARSIKNHKDTATEYSCLDEDLRAALLIVRHLLLASPRLLQLFACLFTRWEGISNCYRRAAER
jgi:hypothetical protein